MPNIQGTIQNIKYQDPSSGWSVVTVQVNETSCVTVTGIMTGLRLGMTAEFTGDYEKTRYGLQFKATGFTEVRPSDKEGIYKYLSSGLIKNIGPVFARKIVDTFGEQTLEILDSHPERLKELPGIGPKRVASVIESVKEQTAIRSIMIWLKRYDLPNGIAAKIYKTYGPDSVAVLEDNPYKLSDDIKGVGFKKADDVASRLGLPYDCTFRIQSGLRACLEDWAVQGNTYMEVDTLSKRTSSEDYLNLDETKVRLVIEGPFFNEVGVLEEGKAFLPKYYFAEKKIAGRLRRILTEGLCDPEARIDYNRLALDNNITYSSQQRLAITMALKNPVMILTGGPGTGKTTTTNAIIQECEARNWSVTLAAPTGRAAKRMEESTGHPSQTIHRLLEYSQGEFQRNETNPIEGDVVIIDEASMIDTILMKDLMKAVAYTSKLVIVGDIDQLPSVGAGSVLRDLIASQAVPTVHLTEIYRQAQGSDIIMNAHAINSGRVPYLGKKDNTDFVFRQIEDKDELADAIIKYVQALTTKGKWRPEDIQVLSPMRRDWDPIGSVMLNKRLQETLNPHGQKVAVKGQNEYRIGDRVMQTKNDYDKLIFNGDIGTITGKLTGEDEDKAILEADFDGETIRFSQEDLQELELAYACTIHKSQGSEYPIVIMPMHTSHFIMLKRNLLYTGITRAKKGCVVLGTIEAVRIAVSKPDTQKRYTYLRERIENAMTGKEPSDTLFDNL